MTPPLRPCPSIRCRGRSATPGSRRIVHICAWPGDEPAIGRTFPWLLTGADG